MYEARHESARRGSSPLERLRPQRAARCAGFPSRIRGRARQTIAPGGFGKSPAPPGASSNQIDVNRDDLELKADTQRVDELAIAERVRRIVAAVEEELVLNTSEDERRV